MFQKVQKTTIWTPSWPKQVSTLANLRPFSIYELQICPEEESELDCDASESDNKVIWFKKLPKKIKHDKSVLINTETTLNQFWLPRRWTFAWLMRYDNYTW